ncbi:MAG TPA: iron-containing alcohol dehydrogenase [Polyangiaceae bacterium]|nr:iron-containing alcohol dehydrogenase [Polyangiaceae bacterium]
MTTFARWSFPTEIRFGLGACKSVGEALAQRGRERALVVTDPGVRGAGLTDPIVASLEAAGIDAAVFDGLAGNPLERHVEDGLAAYHDADADCLVAVGGGSAMDVAKVVAVKVNHHRPLADYDDAKGGDALITEPVPPIVAIPTTAGTGSEVGRSGVVTLRETGRKTVIFAPALLPVVAILDPELTFGLPALLTAATGYDALTHSVEAYVAKGDHPLCDAIALGGIALVARSLARAVDEPGNAEARGDMMKAAMMGAIAFQKGLGACHSLAHPLSAVSELHHGLANALCLPAVVRFNLEQEGLAPRYAEIARILTGEAKAKAEVCADALTELRARLGLPSGLGEAGVSEDDLDKLADEAFADSCHANNPRECTRPDMLALYRASW